MALIEFNQAICIDFIYDFTVLIGFLIVFNLTILLKIARLVGLNDTNTREFLARSRLILIH